MSTPDADRDDQDDIPTAKMCPECKGEGQVSIETESAYMQLRCVWCKGSGRVPVSQTMPRVT